MELSFNMVVGFLIWSAFCLGMLLATRLRSCKWKRAAKAMESHVDNLKREIAALKWERHLQRIRAAKAMELQAANLQKLASHHEDAYMNMRAFAERNGLDTRCHGFMHFKPGQGFERSIPTGVITHAKKL